MVLIKMLLNHRIVAKPQNPHFPLPKKLKTMKACL